MGKIVTVTLPDIGEGVVEGEVIEWLKKENDLLKQDEPVVVVMTDKATVELPSPYPGKLAKCHYQPGQVAIRGKPLYDLEVEGEVPSSSKEAPEKSPQPSTPIAPEKKKQTPQGKALAAPPVRQLAKQLGVNLSDVKGSGKEGRVLAEDLKNHLGAASLPQVSSDDEIRPVIGIRLLMAQKMAESKAHIPHFSYFEEADVTKLIDLREKVKEEAEKEGLHATFLPFFIKALSHCIKKFPEMNSSFDEENQQLVIHHAHHIGIAMATRLGLIVPVLRHVEKMTIEQVIRSYEELREKAQTAKLSSSEMKGSTITISNFGVLGGGKWATPIINYPEAAIVAFAKIRKQPVVKGGDTIIRDILPVSWSFDHRIIDGEMAAAISQEFCRLLVNPLALL